MVPFLWRNRGKLLLCLFVIYIILESTSADKKKHKRKHKHKKGKDDSDEDDDDPGCYPGRNCIPGCYCGHEGECRPFFAPKSPQHGKWQCRPFNYPQWKVYGKKHKKGSKDDGNSTIIYFPHMDEKWNPIKSLLAKNNYTAYDELAMDLAVATLKLKKDLQMLESTSESVYPTTQSAVHSDNSTGASLGDGKSRSMAFLQKMH